MLILNISDIHFKEPQCLRPDTDPDLPYRTRMLQDLRGQVQQRGQVGAIIIVGDVAFKGDPAEYRVAENWIHELVEATGCHLERVFVVPGNHDVDRRVIGQSLATRNAQNSIIRCTPQQREGELRAQFEDAETGGALLKPLDAYNEFARAFNCQIYGPDHLYWKQDLDLDQGVKLRLYGLTSAVLSGPAGQDDAPGKLYLSPLQTVFNPVEDVVNVAVCHHPPDWFLDAEDADEKICNRCSLHLFGHRHRQRPTMTQDYVRINSGAINPDRREAGWQPAYSLIDVQVSGQGVTRELVVNVSLREWQPNPERFRAVQNNDDSEIFVQSIAIPDRKSDRGVTPSTPDLTEEAVAPAAAPDAEASMSDERTRNLVYRFWQLTVGQRRDIALKLKLISEDDMKTPEAERYGRALLRAAQEEKLEELATEVEKCEGLR